MLHWVSYSEDLAKHINELYENYINFVPLKQVVALTFKDLTTNGVKIDLKRDFNRIIIIIIIIIIITLSQM